MQQQQRLIFVAAVAATFIFFCLTGLISGVNRGQVKSLKEGFETLRTVAAGFYSPDVITAVHPTDSKH